MPPLETPVIRCEGPEDHSAVRSVNEMAFGRPDEARLVERLRAEGVVLLSLVAEMDNRVVGHILFSRMWIDTALGSLPAVALAPMSVLPAHQRQGIGGRLVEAGLKRLRECGELMVLVLGHPGYYPRFGFSTRSASLLESPFPRDAFMAIELRPGALEGIRGKVRYPAPFGVA